MEKVCFCPYLVHIGSGYAVVVQSVRCWITYIRYLKWRWLSGSYVNYLCFSML